MGILEILFLLLSTTTLSTVQAGDTNVCPNSNCGSLSLSYPFKLHDTKTQDNCTYIDLNCNTTLNNGTAIVTLPDAGDFYVRSISCHDPHIELYDPGNCLMRRLMRNLNLSSSPFKAVSYENYTFYICPNANATYFFPINCLSNSTNSTVAMAFPPEDDVMSTLGCQVIGSWLLPVSYPGQFEFDGINDDDLYLTWNSTSCIACEDHTDPPSPAENAGGSTYNSFDNFAASPYTGPAFVIIAILLTGCSLSVARIIGRRNETGTDDEQSVSASATGAPPGITAGGLDESKINSCTELVVLSESTINPGTDLQSCPICLENYHSQELVRSIEKCGHCFHADCVEVWLRKSSTCPVCRTIISEIHL